MTIFCKRLFATLALLVGATLNTPAASFTIQGVAPVAAVRTVSPPAMTATFTVSAAGSTQAWTASLEGNPTWAGLSATSGTGAGSLNISFTSTALAAGTYTTALSLNSGGTISRQPFTLTVIQPNVVKMEADLNRPVIYALHRGTEATNPPGYLIFLNTNTDLVEKVISVGVNPTDLDISYQEQMLYVSNHKIATGSIRVIDLATRSEVRAMNAGADIYKINAGKSGRIVTEGYDQWIYADIRNSATGVSLASSGEREGDGEFEPTGRFYFRSDNNSSAATLTRYDLAADTFATRRIGTTRAFGSRTLVMSGDGSRLFWQTYGYDTELTELRTYAGTIYGSTFRGEVVFSDNKAYNGVTGTQLATLPVTSQIQAVSGDQQKLFQFNSSTGLFTRTLMSTVTTVPRPTSAPTPAHNSAVLIPLSQLEWTSSGALRYQVYFGTDEAAVAAATPASPQYQGETASLKWPIAAANQAGTNYYWRVDPVRYYTVPPGPVWKFTTASLVVTPNPISVVMPRLSQPVTIPISTSSAVPGPWTATESLSWLTLSANSGTSGQTLTATLDSSAFVKSGTYTGNITFTHGGLTFLLPVTYEVFELYILNMVSDPSRPWIYGLTPGGAGNATYPKGYVVMINTNTKRIERAVEVNVEATDMTINHQEGKLYIGKWQGSEVQVLDLATQTLFEPLPSGSDVFKLNAGRNGRIYAEGKSGTISAWAIDSSTGLVVSTLAGGFKEGDAEVDPSGRYYYHCDSIAGGGLHKYGITGDTWTLLKSGGLSSEIGARNLVMSQDGSRLFWKKQVFDADLKILGTLSNEVVACTQRGEFAATDTRVLNATTGVSVATLPTDAQVSAFSGDQSALCYFDKYTGRIAFFDVRTTAPVVPPGTNFQPARNSTQLSSLAKLSWDVVPSALKYRVFYGTSAASVAAATIASPEFAGETVENFWTLPPGVVRGGVDFFWRVDMVGLNATTDGSVNSFKVLPVAPTPSSVETKSMVGAAAFRVPLLVTGNPATWTATTAGAAWLRVVTPNGSTGGTLEVELTPGALTAGSYTGSVSFSAGGSTVQIPVKLTLEVAKYVMLKADQNRPLLYALHRPTSLVGSVVVINTTTSAVERVIPVSSNPTDIALAPDGQFLYVVTLGGRKMHRLNLTDWTMEERSLPASADHSDPAVRYRVAAGSGSKVYWVDGEWAPRLHSLDFATGAETGPAILADEFSYGFGAIASTNGGNKLASWVQYGWSAGSSGSRALPVDVSGASAVAGAGAIALNRDPLDTPVLVKPDGSAVFMKRYKLSPDLATVIKEYSTEVYAIMRDRGIVFGAYGAWREGSGNLVWRAPSGADISISAVAGDQSAFFYFDTTAGTLVKVLISTLGDVPGPQPEDGEVVAATPPALSWTPNSQAIRYEVYFGKDQTTVLNAAGTASPAYLGSSTQPTIPVSVPFTPGGLWWWRVDTVLAGSTIKGALWRFSGQLDFLGLMTGASGTSGYALEPSMVMEGTTILSGYPAYSEDYNNLPGRVLVHQRQPGTEFWSVTQAIPKPASASASAQFGAAVAIKGDIAWIGAPYDTPAGGRIYEYRQDPLSRQWIATGRTLQSPTPSGDAAFGASLAFDGVTLVVGSPLALLGSNAYAGLVEIFDAVSLTRQARISEATQSYAAYYGKYIALSGGLLAVSSPSRTVGTTLNVGAVDIWTRGLTNTWGRTTTITPAVASTRVFGSAVAMVGTKLFVGSGSDLSNGTVFVYQKTAGNAWIANTPIPRAGTERTDQFGSSLAVNGDQIAIGTPSYYAPSVPNQFTEVWLHRNTSGQTFTPVAPPIPPASQSLTSFGFRVGLTERYLAVMHKSDPNYLAGVSVYVHNPAGNLPPAMASRPILFAEEGKPYRYLLRAIDENPGDTLSFTAVATLPAWLQLVNNGDGTALLSGTPPLGSASNLALNLMATDSAGGSASQSFTLQVLPPGGIPEITTSTGNLTSDDGLRVQLGVTVTGATPTYQWYQNGVPIPGQTASLLVFNRVQASDAGTYVARVTRNGIWVDTEPMVLTVNQVPDRFGGDWPTFGNGPSHGGTYPATLSRHKFLTAWSLANAAVNQVATGDGRIYAVEGGRFTPNPFMAAYDLNTGTRLWSTGVPVSSSLNPPTYHRGKVYMQRGKEGSDSPDLRCYEAATGQLNWKSNFTAQWESYYAPTVDDTGIYINGGSYGGLYRFGLDGVQNFFRSLPQYDQWTPLLHQGNLYSWVAGNFIQHNLTDGASTFSLGLSTQTTPYSMNTVAVAEDATAVVRSPGEVIGLDLANHKVRWRKAGTFTGTPAMKHGRTYVIGSAGVQSFDSLTGNPGLLYPTVGTSGQAVTGIHQPVLLDDTLLVSSAEMIWSFDLATGAVLQKLVGGGPLTYTDGMLLAVANDHTLRAWKVNQPSSLTPETPTIAATEDIPLQWKLTVADPDGDTPALSISGLPDWLSASPVQQGVITFTGTPLNPHAGPFEFTVRADDRLSFPTSLLIQGSVLAVNDRPTALNPPQISVDEDAVINPLGLSPFFTDEEDTFSMLNLAIAENSNPALFTSLTISGGQLRTVLTPNAFGSATVRLTATDSGGLSVDAVVSFVVAPVNDKPTGALDGIVVNEDAATVMVNLDDFFADIESADNALSFQVGSSAPEIVNASLSGHTLRLTPQLNAFGAPTVTVRCQDPEGAFVDVPFTMTVLSVNDFPTGSLPAIVVDEDAPEIVIDLAAAFADIETPDAALRFTAISFAPGIVSAAVIGSVLKLTPQRDANGQLQVSVKCEDTDGGSLELEFAVTVNPVNDPPQIAASLPNIGAGDAAPDVVIDFSPYVIDPDVGDPHTWHIIANDHPELFSELSFDAQGRLTIHYAPYVSGIATVMVELRDGAGTTAQRSITITLPVLPAPSIVTRSALVLNRQTGLYEQTVTVKNIGKRAIGGFELSVTGLPASACLWNGSDCRAAVGVAGYYQPLAPDQTVSLILEYYTPVRATLTPILSTATVLPVATSSSPPGEVAIDRATMLEPGAFLLEFTAVPGHLYMVQYSNGGAWADSLVRIRAAGNRVQWIDRGSPRTSSPPMPGKSRFYRVKHLSAP